MWIRKSCYIFKLKKHDDNNTRTSNWSSMILIYTVCEWRKSRKKDIHIDQIFFFSWVAVLNFLFYLLQAFYSIHFFYLIILNIIFWKKNRFFPGAFTFTLKPGSNDYIYMTKILSESYQNKSNTIYAIDCCFWDLNNRF